MKFIVQYIPLTKIKRKSSSGTAARADSKRLKLLQQAAKDCMSLLIVRKTRDGYVLLSGNRQYEYLKKYTRLKAAPCIVDEPALTSAVSKWLNGLRKRKLPYELPHITREQTSANSWAIIRTFMKQEPRFRRLSRSQQWKVLLLGIRYKQTTLRSMKAKVGELLSQSS